MITRNSWIQTYHDRTGRYTLFHDAIDQLGIKRHGDSWRGSISRYKPQLIPRDKSQANMQQVLFAADVILHHRSLADITQVSYDGDEAWIGMQKPFDLNISEEDWAFAHTKSDQCSGQWDREFNELSHLLDVFCVLAANKNLKCYTRHRDRVEMKALASEMWNVSIEVLWSRYISGCIDIHSPFTIKEDGRYIILVDNDDIQRLESVCETSRIENLEDVREELIAAAKDNPYVAPGNDKATLIRSVAQRIRITQKAARALVDGIPGQHWDKRGPRSKGDNYGAKYIHKG